MRIAIIGGGAAGFFAAIHAAENHPEAEIHLLEKSRKLLSKVKISGGGRCNVTHNAASTSALAKAYPRGQKQLKKAFRIFDHKRTMQWFEERGVPLMTQEDGCVFPVSQNSQSIIDCFQSEARRLGVAIHTQCPVSALRPKAGGWQLQSPKTLPETDFDKVIVATGGSPKMKGLEWLAELGHSITPPVPSLFTFNMPNETVTELMGIVVENALSRIEGTPLTARGPLLITHWGMSGPAILVLSAFGARLLAERDYNFRTLINWTGISRHDEVAATLGEIERAQSRKTLANYRPFKLPERLWHFLLERAGLPKERRWGEIGKKGRNKITDVLTHDGYQVSGKTTFKEEFVTCGGVSLQDVDFKSMQSRIRPGLYFAGEVLDIDGVTGGFNFQSAWTTAFIAARLAD